MGFDRLKFTKEWTNAVDFPTVETDEAKVRADMQLLHDETMAALNKLMDALEAVESAAKLGAKTPEGAVSSVQAQLDHLYESQLKAGALPMGGGIEQMLVKSSDENYETRWAGIAEIVAAIRAKANGVASLNGDSEIPLGQIPKELKDRVEEVFDTLSAALEAKVVTGTYTGNGASSRTIALGFTPKAVLVMSKKANFRLVGNSYGSFGTVALAVTNAPSTAYYWDLLAIVEGGFSVKSERRADSSGGAESVNTNDSNQVYHYIAFA